MKLIMFVFVTILTLTAWSQNKYDYSSFYFELSNLEIDSSFDGFSESNVGFYVINEENRRHLVIDPDSIYVRSGFEVIVPKKIALDKGFTFDKEKMYGMEPYNGIYYQEYNDTIFALYYQNDHYFGASDFIIKGDDGYFLFTPESDNYYSCEYIFFENNEIFISSIDHSTVMDKILKLSHVYKKHDEKIDVYIAKPSLKDLEYLVKKKCFNELRSYEKTEHL